MLIGKDCTLTHTPLAGGIGKIMGKNFALRLMDINGSKFHTIFLQSADFFEP
jgi:hypothetical protein